MSEETTQWQPSAEDREAFDFLWQHLRRNSHYRKDWTEYQAQVKRREKLRQEAVAERAKLEAELDSTAAEAKRTGRFGYVGSIPVETAKEKELRELPAFPQSVLDAEFSGRWRGGMIDPDHDTDTAMREVLENSQGSFCPDEWRRLSRRLSAPPVIWNWRGSEGCAWQNTPDESGDFHAFDELQTSLEEAERHGDNEAVTKCHAKIREFLAAEHSRRKPPSGDSHTFESLERMVNKTAEQVEEVKRLLAEIKRPEHVGKRLVLDSSFLAADGRCWPVRGPVDTAWMEDAHRKCEQEHETAKARMKKFLQDHSLMDFVLDTSLPVGTVKDELEKIVVKIKQLRVYVGLPEDEAAGRMPSKWEQQLALRNACEPRRKRRMALGQLVKRDLGFVDYFRLAEVELPDDQLAFAQKLDAAGKKPPEVFNIVVEIERDPSRAVKLPRAARGEYQNDGQPREHIAATGPEDADADANQGSVTGDESYDFDYDAIDANLGRTEPTVRPVTESSAGNVEAGFLREWLSHFSIPAVTLPDSAKNLPDSTRKSWLREARRRIAAAWPGAGSA